MDEDEARLARTIEVRRARLGRDLEQLQDRVHRVQRRSRRLARRIGAACLTVVALLIVRNVWRQRALRAALERGNG